MNIWYDRGLDWQQLGFEDTSVDLDGIIKSGDEVLMAVRGAMASFDHVFLGGFSMGGGLVLNMMQRQLPEKVRGLFCMGSFVVEASPVLQGDIHAGAKKLPVLMMHGDADSMVSAQWAEKTATALLLLGVEVQFRKFENVEHEIDGLELRDLVYWVRDIVSVLVNEKEKEKSAKVSTSSGAADADKGGACDDNIVSMSAQQNVQESEKKPVNLESMAVETAPEATLSGDESPIRYRLMEVTTGPVPANTYIVDYQVPPRLVKVVAARDVLCCGAVFEMSPSPDGDGVRTQICSADPHRTCKEIGTRLLKRLDDDPNNPINPCPMS